MIKKSAFIFLAAACGSFPLNGIAQSPATPPPIVAPVPPVPPSVPDAPPAQRLSPPRPAGRSQPSVFLGVETGPVPGALSDQLNLPDGFGLLVDYVVPGSAAETAGVKKHDILKMLNDQILTGEDQLSTLVRSFSEGQEISLLVLRKGTETKLTAKLQKRSGQHPAGRGPRERHDDFTDESNRNFHFDLDDLSNPDFEDRIRASVDRSRAQIDAATARINEQVQRATERAREVSARATGSRFDLDGARILLRDSSGRIEIRSARGKRTLTARDADGKKVFDGPIDTPEQRKLIPADILPQVETLEREQVVTFPDAVRDSEERSE